MLCYIFYFCFITYLIYPSFYPWNKASCIFDTFQKKLQIFVLFTSKYFRRHIINLTSKFVHSYKYQILRKKLTHNTSVILMNYLFDLLKFKHHYVIPYRWVRNSHTEEYEVWHMFTVVLKINCRDFSGGPVIKTRTSPIGGIGSIPGQGTKILHVMWCGQKKKKKINYIPGALSLLYYQ